MAREPPKAWRATAALRLGLALALALLVLAVVLVVRAVTTGAAQDPGIGAQPGHDERAVRRPVSPTLG